VTRRRHTIAVRDQRASVFGAVLMRLCDSVSAVGAALVDAEGETVDYAGAIDPFDIKVTAAEWVVVLFLLRQSKIASWCATETVIVRAARKSYFVRVIGEGYAIVLRLLPHAFSVSSRGMNEAIRELCAEAGLSLPPALLEEAETFHRVDVRCEPKRSRRPSAVWLGGTWTPVEVLGRWTTDLGRREVGYRARLASGAEVTLIRERMGRWYSDGPPTL
jgi:hypothetical protein